MALSGSFSNYPVSGSNFGLYCEWTGSQSKSGNYTNITLKVYLRVWDVYVGARSGNTGSINGVSFTYDTPAISDSGSSWHNILLTTKTQKVTHNADGTKTGVSLSAKWTFNGTYSGTYVSSITASTTVNLDTITTYTLSTSAGTGSSITVNRTASGYGATGNLSNGARLYYGDTLKITFTPSSNYAINTHTVNGSTFTSGNSHTVSANVSVVSTATVLASSVGATNANIGSTSTITVTKYSSSYYHSLQYSFGNISGYIKADGTTSSSEVKFSQTSVAFTVPTTFYAQIPSAKTGTCTITCRTYSSSSSTTVLGTAKTCTFTATASSSACSPTVSGTVVDTNATTIALTGNSSNLIRYKSTAVCTISATGRQSATISSKLINDVAPTSDQRTFTNVSTTSFVFKATDSRGYTSSHTETPTMIAYVNLTCNPLIYRPTPTGSEIVMTLSGDLYRGSFGAYSNSLTLQYRYKQQGGSYGSWTTISSGITYGTNSYRIASAMSLGNSFDYQKEYVFQVKAYDGANGTTLSTVTKTITVQRGTPVFDWGEDDFNFNVPVSVNGERAFLVKYKDVTFSSVALTTQGASGVYYRSSGYDLTGTECGFQTAPTIIGLTLLACTNVPASFVPYFNASTSKINFYSDISQTIGTVVLRIIYA